jgi:LEA14-like dessication related protein
MRNEILLVVVPLIGACSAVDALTPKAPDVDEKVCVTTINPAGVELLVEINVKNPNGIGLEATSLTAKVVLDDRYDMGTVEVPQEVDFPADEEVHVSVPVTVDWRDASIVASLIALQRDVPYDIYGNVRVGIDLFKVNVHFHVSDVITEEQMRQAAPGGVQSRSSTGTTRNASCARAVAPILASSL